MANDKLKADSVDPWWVRWLLIGATVGFMVFLLVLPLGVIFWEAIRKGWGVYVKALTDRSARNAIMLSLVAAGISVSTVPGSLIHSTPVGICLHSSTAALDSCRRTSTSGSSRGLFRGTAVKC